MVKVHQTRGFLICLGITLLVLGIYVFNGFDALELKAVDFRFQWRGDRPRDPNIVVVTIDEASIEQLGRWPWPRATHAQLTELLSDAGAQVVTFDSLFTELDKEHPESDTQLAEAAGNTGLMVSAFLFRGGIDQRVFGKDPLFPYEGLTRNSYVGFVNLDPDRDGVTRRAHLYAIEGEVVYPSLAVATFAMAQGKTVEEIISKLPIVLSPDPLLAENDLFINYSFDPRSPTGYPYPTFSFADVLNEKIDVFETFENKIVFVGATAAALFDLKAIPFISKHPGVMIHANVLDNLIHENYIHEIPTYITTLYILLVGLVLGFFLPRYSPWIKLGVFSVVTLVGVGLGLWLFSHHDLVIHMVPPLFVCGGSYGGILFYRLVIEEREKRKIKGSFKQYLSPKIIDIMTKDPSKLKLGGEEREVTIFFLDIAGFTTMSEALKPSQLVEVMNQCLTCFSHIILKHEGLINKYIGDCIMAFWNSPVDQPRHASLACWAGLDCIKALPSLNADFKKKGLPSIDCRIGINTGVVVVGNMGSNEKFDYTVMGDPVNLASRLEGANKEYHTHIMISDETFEKAKQDIEGRDLDLIRVKGKKEPRKVFELLCRKGEMANDLKHGRHKYHEALRLYRQRQFQEALHTFQEVLDYIPNDALARKYLERTRAFTITPPPVNWDGVFEMKTK